MRCSSGEAHVTLGPGYFEEMYAASDDPWGLATRWYEARKYAISVALLPQERYHDAFEPGCSIGTLSEMLAPRCDRLLSCDVAENAVRAAAIATASRRNVQVQRRHIPRDWPAGGFDLIVFSEFLYYFGGDDLNQVLDLAVAALRSNGSLLAVHWRHPVADYPRSGDEVHLALGRRPGLARLVKHTEPDFLAEVYIRTEGEPVSVAQAGGLA
jgi:cyclopropane fatty-acyl-phospholipid synthase-like methyltransferase